MRRSFVLGIVAALALCAVAHLSGTGMASAAGDDPKQRSATFFRLLIEGQTNQAYDGLFAGAGTIGVQAPAIDAVKSQTTAQLPIYGKPIDSEFISEEKFGTSVVRLVYVLKMERHPVVWEFYFYRPHDDWVLSQVVFDDRFRVLGPKVALGTPGK